MKWLKRETLGVMVGTLILLGLTQGSALAEDRPQNVVSTDAIGLVQGTINLEYERAVSRGMSFYVAPLLGFGRDYTAFGVVGGIKKYLVGVFPGGLERFFGAPAPEGLWIGGFGSFLTAGAMGYSVNSFGGGANAGYKYFITDRFTVEGRLGVAYYVVSGYGGFFDVLGGVNVGYAF